jgi:hypothetical protein
MVLCDTGGRKIWPLLVYNASIHEFEVGIFATHDFKRTRRELYRLFNMRTGIKF